MRDLPGRNDKTGSSGALYSRRHRQRRAAMAAALKAVEQGARVTLDERKSSAAPASMSVVCRPRSARSAPPISPIWVPGKPVRWRHRRYHADHPHGGCWPRRRPASMNCATPSTKASGVAIRRSPVASAPPALRTIATDRIQRRRRARGGIRPLPDRHRVPVPAVPLIPGLKDTPAGLPLKRIGQRDDS